MQAVIPHLEEGSTITFNASINMAVGHPELIDYTATKGAMVGFMRALSNQIVGEKNIRCIEKIYDGYHLWKVWRECVRDFLPLLFH